MTRNLNHRVEIAVPVYDKRLQEQVKWVLDAQLRDTAKASLMLSDGTYCRKHSAVPFDSQDDFMKQSPHIPAEPLKESPTFSQRLKHILAELISAISKGTKPSGIKKILLPR